MKHFILLLVCCLLLPRSTGAQEGKPRDWVVELPFTIYNSAQGLIHNRCCAVREDGMGYMWAATDMGICRYDGRSFKHFPCPDGFPYRGIYNNVRDGDWVVYPIVGFGAAIAKGDSVRFFRCGNMALGFVASILRTGDTSFLLADAPNGLVELRGSKATRLRLPDSSNIEAAQMVELARDSRGNLWIGTSKGLVVLPGGRVSAAMRIPFWDSTYINAVRQDSAGNILIVSAKGLHRYPAGLLNRLPDLRRAVPALLLPLLGRGFTSVYAEPGGSVWVASSPTGCYRINPADGSYQHITPANGFSAYTAWEISSDHEGNIWFATENGIARLSRTDFVRVNFKQGLADKINYIVPLAEDLMLVSADGEGYYTVGPDAAVNRVSARPDPGSLFTERHRRMADGSIWITSITSPVNVSAEFQTAVYRYQSGSLVYQYPLSRLPGAPDLIDFKHSHARTTNGDEWLLTSKALYLYRNGRFESYRPGGPDGPPSNAAAVCTGRDGILYVFFGKKGLIGYRIMPATTGSNTYQLQPVTTVMNATVAEMNPEAMYADSRGWIWLYGAHSGLAVIYPKSGKVQVLNDQLSAPYVTSLEEDSSGAIWIGTASGLDKATVQKDGSFRIEKALYNAELSNRFIFFAKPVGNKVYIGTNGYLGIADLRSGTVKAAGAPPVYITRLVINGKDYSPRLKETEPLLLAPEENNLSFEFTGLSYADEKSVRYSYLLEGAGADWSEPGTDYRVTYTRLPPGDYTLRVRAYNKNGLVSDKQASLRFRIRKPFYSSWWFIALCAGAVATATYLIYRYRINQLLAVQQMRQRISKDLHDDIGATVSSIGILADMVRDGRGSAEKQRQFLETIAEESRYVAQTLSDIVWTINPRNDSLEAIFARMQRYASELFEAKGIQYRITLPQQPGVAAMDMHSRQHLYLIFKEAVNNLAKYAAASEAIVDSTITGGRLLLTIRDNGRGFDTTAEAAGNGIANMHKRADEMSALLTIRSEPGRGTDVVLDAPAG